MSDLIRNRIKGHRRVRAGDLIPHEWNFRTHPEKQAKALRAILKDVGFARSLLAFETVDGKLKLIDGHLRRDLDPEQEVEVEILDVTEEEARVLLLSIDPLAALAQTQEQLHERLKEIAPPVSPELQAAWAAQAHEAMDRLERPGFTDFPEQFYVLVKCADEKRQIELLGRFKSEGLDCNAVLC